MECGKLSKWLLRHTAAPSAKPMQWAECLLLKSDSLVDWGLMFSVVLSVGEGWELEPRSDLHRTFPCEHRTITLFAAGLLSLNSVKEGWLGQFCPGVLEFLTRPLMLTASCWLVEATLVSSDPFALDLIRRNWSAQHSGFEVGGSGGRLERSTLSSAWEISERGSLLGFLTSIALPPPQDLCTWTCY